MTEKRTYTIPLRREFRETERYNKTKRATSGVRKFLQKHMKADEVKIGSSLNEKLWSRGGRNPPHKIVVVAEKDGEGVVFADLEGKELPTDVARAEAAKEKKEKKEAPSKTSGSKETVKEEKSS